MWHWMLYQVESVVEAIIAAVDYLAYGIDWAIDRTPWHWLLFGAISIAFVYLLSI